MDMLPQTRLTFFFFYILVSHTPAVGLTEVSRPAKRQQFIFFSKSLYSWANCSTRYSLFFQTYIVGTRLLFLLNYVVLLGSSASLSNYSYDILLLTLSLLVVLLGKSYSLLYLVVTSELLWISFFICVHTKLLSVSVVSLIYIFIFFLSIATLDLAYAVSVIFYCGSYSNDLRPTQSTEVGLSDRFSAYARVESSPN